MKYVQPIRNKGIIENFKRELKIGSRDWMLFVFGINTGLRISDILKLKVSDVRDRTHLILVEGKTSKPKRINISNIRDDLDNYIKTMQDDEYLFQSRIGSNKPISRIQAYRVLNDAADRLNIGEIGTHTLRKTFGYHFYQKTKDVALLQELFNHSAPSITMRYIGINQDNMDRAMVDFKL